MSNEKFEPLRGTVGFLMIALLPINCWMW